LDLEITPIGRDHRRREYSEEGVGVQGVTFDHLLRSMVQRYGR
jgi:hypothetical protein